MSRKPISHLRTYFKEKGFNDEQIDFLYSRLPNNYRQILDLRFGPDWDNPVLSEFEDKKIESYYRSFMLPNMIKMLKNTSFKPRPHFTKIENEEIEAEPKKVSEQVLKEKSIYDFIKSEENEEQTIDYNMLNLTQFEEFLKKRSLYEIIVTSLKFGGINGRKYSIEEISDFLNKSDISLTIIGVLDDYTKFIVDELDRVKDRINSQQEVLVEPNNNQSLMLSYQGYVINESLKCAVIVGLSMGYVTDNPIDNNEIARFLRITPEEVVEIVRNSLVGYKQYASSIINATIDTLNIAGINEDGKVSIQKKLVKNPQN